MFVAKRRMSTNANLLPGGILNLADNKPMGGILQKGSGFELYIGQMPGIWGNNGRSSMFVMTYEKPGAPSTTTCKSSQFRIDKPQFQK
jgi:hypothetical protein